ncbi:MAG TPA: selenide, water dikinase SelD [Solirubrobacterales bacterium]
MEVQTGAVRLTQLSHGAGCACKLGPGELESVLESIGTPQDPSLLVGARTRDDAAVYRLSDELALVQTADFFTPIVDDPYDFGRIAAANALSDVYAMGGEPRLALNLVAFPLGELGHEVLERILRGGAEVADEAGAVIAGGHSIDDPEPKYGMAVTGLVDPERYLANSGARPGDAIHLTKAIGGGLATTAAKRGLAGEDVIASAVETMTELNRDSSRAALEAGATAMTDVTGFGLLGHLHELCEASGVSAEIRGSAVPAIEGALERAADERCHAGGSRRNSEYATRFTDYAEGVPEPRRFLLADAMTSGGLLVAVPPDHTGDAPGVRIGTITEGSPGRIAVV